MANQIEVLKQTELLGQQFEVYGTPQEPLFKAKDVAALIRHSNITKMLELVDEDEKGVKYLLTPGGSQQVWFLTENGLYEVLMQSRKAIAKKFKKGVKTILKEIRTTGGYIATQEVDTPEMIMARALKVAEQTIIKHQQRLQLVEAERDNLQTQIKADAPKVVFADALIGSRSSCLIGELAKVITQSGYPIGQNRLFAYLRDSGYLGKKGERYNVPNQQYIEQGLFEIKKGVRSGSEGVMHTTITTKVTTKGQAYFINKFLNQANQAV